MKALYLLHPQLLLGGILVMTGCVAAQAMCLVYGFFRFHYQRKDLWLSLLDGAILAQLLVLTRFFCETLYHMGEGFLVVRPLAGLRWGTFLAMVLLAAAAAAQKKVLSPLGAPLTAMLTLPEAEAFCGEAFLVVLPVAIGLWLLGAINRLWLYRKLTRERLSAFSVKEAVDTMDFGVLFYREEGSARGQILLANRKMQELMFALAGRQLYSGIRFRELLEAGQGRKDAGWMDSLYLLADGSVWLFAPEALEIRGKKCCLITASNVTEQLKATDRLREKNRELEQRNEELREMLQNLDQVCRQEQTLRAKARVHDLLGQRISQILRSVREKEEPEEGLLEYFADGLPTELRDPPEDQQYSLQKLAENFASLRVDIRTTGALPGRKELRKAFSELAAEAVTNAIRHGYATAVSIDITCRRQVWQMEIRDNGLSVEGPVSEGGGLREMRRKITELGGRFTYVTSPRFVITASVPEGGLL